MRKSKVLLLIAAGLVVALVAGGVVWHVTRDTHATGSIGENVTIIGTAPRELTARTSNSKPPVKKPELAEIVSKTFDIGPSGMLAAPTTFELPLNRKASSKERLVVLTAPSGGKWSVLPAQLMPGGRSVRVVTSHLSLFSVVSLNVSRMAEELKKLIRNFYDDLSSGATAEAKPPVCKGEQTARQSLTVSSDHGNAVFWCLGTENGKQAVKIVNNRRYALVGDFSNFKLVQRGSNELRLDQLAKYLEKDSVVLFARDQASFEVQLPGGFDATAKLKLSISGKAFLFNTVQAIVETALRILSLVGLKIDALAVTEAVLSNAKCLDTLRDSEVSAGKVIANCFNEQQIMTAFGKPGIVLAPIMLLGGVAESLRSATNAFFDNLKGRDKYTLMVSHQGGKRVTFRGMTLHVPAQWSEREPFDATPDFVYDGKYLSFGKSCVTFRQFGTTLKECPAIVIDGPKQIAMANENGPFDLGQPYHPGSGVENCPGTPAIKYGQPKLIKSGLANIGNHRAYYRVWKEWCGTSKSKWGTPPYKFVKSITQRIWYLPQSQILIIDEWNTPHLDEILANAEWD